MKKALTLALLGIPLVIATNARADVTDIRASDNAIEFQIGAEHQKYGETIKGTTFDTETGWLPDFHLSGSMLTNPDKAPWILQNIYLKLDGGIAAGNVHYNGAIQQGGRLIPYETVSNSHIYTLDAQIGRAFPIADMVMVTPFLDLGTRYWDRDIPGFAGVDEDYAHGEAMGGILLQVSPVPKWVLSGSAQAGSTFSPVMHTGGTDYPLGNSIVYQLDGKLGYTFASHFEATADAQFKGFNYGNSSLINGALEPNSSTHELAVLLGIAYHWR